MCPRSQMMQILRDANAYCVARNARLPTISQLQSLRANKAPGNSEMCTKYGWPLFGQCGGSRSLYWASDSNIDDGSRDYWLVGMDTGDYYRDNLNAFAYVACVR
ncbi:adhesion domain-containing protein [Aeromonas veronii]